MVGFKKKLFDLNQEMYAIGNILVQMEDQLKRGVKTKEERKK